MLRSGRFTPGKDTRYLFYRRLGEPQGQSGQVRKISPPPGFHPRTVQPVVSRYTDYAISAKLIWQDDNNKMEFEIVFEDMDCIDMVSG
jgi:hypothetical protein